MLVLKVLMGIWMAAMFMAPVQVRPPYTTRPSMGLEFMRLPVKHHGFLRSMISSAAGSSLDSGKASSREDIEKSSSGSLDTLLVGVYISHQDGGTALCGRSG